MAQHHRYHRHVILPDIGLAGQQKINQAAVLVVGAGGLGSPVLLYLATAGVGKIGIIDHDLVDITNLQRQVLYTEADVGQPKARAASRHLKKINSDIQILDFAHQLTPKNASEIISQFDIIVDAVDNFSTRYLISDTCVAFNKPMVHGSVYRYEGQVSVFNTGCGSYRDLFPKPPSASVSPDCSDAGVLGPIVGIIGTIQATEVLKLIVGIGEHLGGRMFIIDGLTMATRVVQLTSKNKSDFINSKKQKEMVKEITPEELAKWMEEGVDFQLIDVREPAEYEEKNMHGELIPLGTLPDNLYKILSDKKVVVHCRSGARSGQAVKYIQQTTDAKEVYNLKGGILAWNNFKHDKK